jgi:hypothetical protein
MSKGSAEDVAYDKAQNAGQANPCQRAADGKGRAVSKVSRTAAPSSTNTPPARAMAISSPPFAVPDEECAPDADGGRPSCTVTGQACTLGNMCLGRRPGTSFSNFCPIMKSRRRQPLDVNSG